MNISIGRGRSLLLAAVLGITSSCLAEEPITKHHERTGGTRTLSLGVIDLARKIAEEPWPASQSKLSTDLEIQFDHSKRLSTNLQIYRSLPIKTIDGYDIEYVEYRTQTKNADELVSYIEISLSANRCYSMNDARKALDVNSRKMWFPSHYAPDQKPVYIYSRNIEGSELVITSIEDDSRCVSTIVKRKVRTPLLPISRDRTISRGGK